MTDQPRSGLTAGEGAVALESEELRDAVAFLVLSVAHDPDAAMESFLGWCVAHGDEIRAEASTQHLDQYCCAQPPRRRWPETTHPARLRRPRG
jgi:hypothetical protein